MSDPTQAAPDAVDTTNQIATGEASDPRPANDEGHADPLWGEVLAPVNLKLTRKTTEAEKAVLLVDVAKAKVAFDMADAEAKAAAKVKRDAKDALDEATTQATVGEVEEDRECPVRRRDGELVVLHPDTFEPMELDADQQQLLLPKPKTWADASSEPADPPDYSGADEVAGIDRLTLHARLQRLEGVLAPSRGPLAVPTKSEVDSWPTGVCLATARWLDVIEAEEDDELPVAPIWVLGWHGASQKLLPAFTRVADQLQALHRALHVGLNLVVVAFEDWTDAEGFDSCSEVLDGIDPNWPVLSITEGTRRLPLGQLVDRMKLREVVRGTTAHFAEVARVVADSDGLPLFRVRVAEAESAELRLLYFVTHAKAAAPGVLKADLIRQTISAAERVLDFKG